MPGTAIRRPDRDRRNSPGPASAISKARCSFSVRRSICGVGSQRFCRSFLTPLTVTRMAGSTPTMPTTKAATDPFWRSGLSRAKYPASAPPVAPTSGNTANDHGSLRPEADGMMRPISAPTRAKPIVPFGVACVLSKTPGSTCAKAERGTADSETTAVSANAHPIRYQLNSPSSCVSAHSTRSLK